jgi:FK506-binding protein 1
MSASSFFSHPNSAALPFSHNLTIGVIKTILYGGDGVAYPKIDDTVVMRYVGTLANGEPFDSPRNHGKPLETKIGAGIVIQGRDEGVPK